MRRTGRTHSAAIGRWRAQSTQFDFTFRGLGDDNRGTPTAAIARARRPRAEWARRRFTGFSTRNGFALIIGAGGVGCRRFTTRFGRRFRSGFGAFRSGGTGRTAVSPASGAQPQDRPVSAFATPFGRITGFARCRLATALSTLAIRGRIGSSRSGLCGAGLARTTPTTAATPRPRGAIRPFAVRCGLTG